jgi:hypothetical protein
MLGSAAGDRGWHRGRGRGCKQERTEAISESQKAILRCELLYERAVVCMEYCEYPSIVIVRPGLMSRLLLANIQCVNNALAGTGSCVDSDSDRH